MEPDAREAAKRAARSAGMTLGAWLNQKILEGEEASGGASSAARTPSGGLRTRDPSPPPADVRAARAAYAERDFGGPAPELGAVSQSIDALRRHLQDEGDRTERTFGQVSRSLEAMLAKLDQASARRNTDVDADTSDSLRAIKSALSDVSQRLSAVETRRDPGQELERSVSDVNRTIDSVRSETTRRIDTVERNVDRIVDRSEARDNRRMDAIRGLERAVTEIVSRVEDVSRRQSEASRDTDRAISGINERLSQRDNAAAIDLLRERIFELSEQIEASREIAKKDTSTDRLSDIERRIADALENTIKAEDLARLETRVTETAEQTVAAAISALQVELREELRDHANRAEQAASSNAVAGHNGGALAELEERMTARFEQMSAQLDILARDIDTHISTLDVTARNEVDALRERLEAGGSRTQAAMPAPAPAFEREPEPEAFEAPELFTKPEPEPEPEETGHLSNAEMHAHLRAAATRPTETGVSFIGRDDEEPGGVRRSVAIFVMLLLLLSIGLIGYSGWRLWSNGEIDFQLPWQQTSRPIETRPANVRPVMPHTEPATTPPQQEEPLAEEPRTSLPSTTRDVEPEPQATETPARPTNTTSTRTPAPAPVQGAPAPATTTTSAVPPSPTAAQLYADALRTFNEGDSAEAASLLEEAAGQGLAVAQYRLGMLYEAGEGVTRNLETARGWYEAAAEGGNARAMYNLAVLYAGGELGPPDYAASARWFAEAAAYDIRDAQYNLAVQFERGLGVRTDLEQAYLWYSIAEHGGDTEAGTRRAALGQRLEESVRTRIDDAANRWQPRPLDPEANGQLSVSHPLGATPAEIARAQELLIDLGYTPGPADGVMGPQTAASIRNFERSTGMTITGRVTPNLISRLQAEVAARNSGG